MGFFPFYLGGEAFWVDAGLNSNSPTTPSLFHQRRSGKRYRHKGAAVTCIMKPMLMNYELRLRVVHFQVRVILWGLENTPLSAENTSKTIVSPQKDFWRSENTQSIVNPKNWQRRSKSNLHWFTWDGHPGVRTSHMGTERDVLCQMCLPKCHQGWASSDSWVSEGPRGEPGRWMNWHLTPSKTTSVFFLTPSVSHTRHGILFSLKEATVIGKSQ